MARMPVRPGCMCLSAPNPTQKVTITIAWKTNIRQFPTSPLQYYKSTYMYIDQKKSTPTSNMCPPVRNQYLHLVDQTSNSTLFPSTPPSSPLSDPASDSSIFEPSCRQPSQNSILPTPMQNRSDANPVISLAVPRIDQIIGMRIVADADVRIQPDAFLC